MPKGVYLRTEECRRNIGKAAKGRVPWSKGLTKETDPRVAKAAATIKSGYDNGRIAWNIGLKGEDYNKHYKPGILQNMAEATRQRQLGSKQSAESNLKRSKKLKGRVTWDKGLTKETDERVAKSAINIGLGVSLAWSNLSEEEKEIRIKSYQNMWKDPLVKTEWISKIRKAANQRPNKIEMYLDELLQTTFPSEWEYVGNGKLIINGLIPDFANINGKKALIELFGDYWHKGENPQDRIDKFVELEYSCLVIWESELKNPSRVIEQITNFIEEVT